MLNFSNSSTNRFSVASSTLLISMALFLSACSNSDSANQAGISYNFSATISEITSTQEYNKNYSNYETVAIAGAWAQGHYGTNVTLAVIDDGVYLNDGEFYGKNIDRTLSVETDDGVYVYNQSLLHEGYSHGTAVAAIMVANFDEYANTDYSDATRDELIDKGITGVAFGANLLDVPLLHFECQYFLCPIDEQADSSFSSQLQPALSTHDQIQVLEDPSPLPNFKQAIIDLHSKSLKIATDGASFINMSYGYSITLESARADSFNDDSIAGVFDHYIQAISQNSTADKDKAVFVISAGNSYSSWSDNAINYAVDPDILATLWLLDSDLEGLIVAAVALDSFNNNYKLASYSNRCGVAWEYCVAAPGGVNSYSVFLDDNYDTDADGVLVPGTGNLTEGYASFTGTSFAAPIITGSLGVIYSAFNGSISPQETLERLLTTADNSSCDASICGRGIVNVTAAVEPIGGLSLQYGQSVYQAIGFGEILPLQVAEGISLSSKDIQATNVVVFDDQHAPFTIPLEHLLVVDSNLPQAISLQFAEQSHQIQLPNNLGKLTHSYSQSGSYWGIEQQGRERTFKLGFEQSTNLAHEPQGSSLTFAADQSLLSSVKNNIQVDLLSASLTQQQGAFAHTLNAGMCTQEIDCIQWGYEVAVSGWNAGYHTHQIQDSSSQQSSWSGVNLLETIQSPISQSKGTWSSLFSSLHISKTLRIDWQRSWAQAEQGSSQAYSQNPWQGSGFNAKEDRVLLNWNTGEFDVEFSVTDQHTAEGYIELALPESRNLSGEIGYGITSLGWNHDVDQTYAVSLSHDSLSCLGASRCQVTAIYQYLDSARSSDLLDQSKIGARVALQF